MFELMFPRKFVPKSFRNFSNTKANAKAVIAVTIEKQVMKTCATALVLHLAMADVSLVPGCCRVTQLGQEMLSKRLGQMKASANSQQSQETRQFCCGALFA